MSCPFPGMDPYIEQALTWADFHDSLIIYIREALQPLLRPRYVALTQERLYVVESDRPIFPDVGILRTSSKKRSPPAGAAVIEVDTPVEFELWQEEIREPYIRIVEPSAKSRTVTAIEVLSPSNKKPGPGYDAYLKKREEFWGSGTNLVEIDLLRQGERTVRIAAEKLESLRPWSYLVAVTRNWPLKQQVYRISLQARLPRVSIPLKRKEADVPLDLQAVFTRCWDSGPYPELLSYQDSPPGPLSPKDANWCEKQLREAGFRAKRRSNGRR